MDTPQQHEEFRNENILVKLAREPGCLVKMQVEVTPEGTKVAYGDACKRVSKQVSLPGFRKGRAPLAMLQQHFGPQIEREWKDSVMNLALRDAVKLTQVAPLNPQNIKPPQVDRCDREEGASLFFHFEAMPDIPEVDASSLDLSGIEKEAISDENVEQAVEALKQQFAERTAIEDRGIEEGDFVELQITDIGGDEGQLCDHQSFHVKDGEMGAWMKDAVIGKKAGETVEAESALDGDASEELREKFKATKCAILVQKIETLADMSDEDLLAKVGAKEMDGLKGHLRKRLESRADMVYYERLGEKVEDQLKEKFEFDIPTSILEEEAKHILHAEMSQLMQKGSDEKAVEEKKPEMEKEARVKALHEVRLLFLYRNTADSKGIRISNKEINEELLARFQSLNLDQATMQNLVKSDELRSSTYMGILKQKVKGLLIAEAEKAEKAEQAGSSS